MIAIVKLTVIGLCCLGALASLGAWGWVSVAARTTARVAGETVRDSVPLSMDVQMLRTRVADLDQVIRNHEQRLISFQVDAEHLEKQVEAQRRLVFGLEDAVKHGRELLVKEGASFVIQGKTFTREQVETQAGREAEALVRGRLQLEGQEKILAQMKAALAKAEETRLKASDDRKQYGMRLAQLEARAEGVRVQAELAANVDLAGGLDRGAFATVERDFQRIEKELELDERRTGAALEPALPVTVPLGRKRAQSTIELLDQALATKPATAP